MGKLFKRTLATIMVVLMVLTSAPLQGFVGMEWPEIDLPNIGNWFGSKASAATEKTWGNYKYTVSDNEITITGHIVCDASVVFPSEIEGKKVTRIGNRAFYSCQKLVYVTFPDTIISIGQEAFYNCNALKSLVFPNELQRISEWAFDSCRGLESVIFGENLNYIGQEAFYGCEKLDSITIFENVTHIGLAAFSKTAYLNNKQNWDDKVLYLGNCLIEADMGLSGSYTIKRETKTIAEKAFSYAGVENIIMPDSVEYIGYRAFNNCKKLKTIQLSKKLSCIGDYVFEKCDALECVEIPNSVTKIGEGLFYLCKNLKTVKLPENITCINYRMFAWCESLVKIDIPKSVTSIASHAFYECNSLVKIDIPKSVTSIASYAFYECNSLESVVLAENVNYYGTDVFDGCSGLKEIYFYNPKASTSVPSKKTVIYGYPNSSAHNYAKKNGNEFKALSDFTFSDNEVVLALGTPVDSVYDGNDLHLIYKPYDENQSEINTSKITFDVADKSVVNVINITAFVRSRNLIDVYANIETLKLGETKVVAKYDGIEVAECKITVDDSNQLRFEIEDPNYMYYEADGVFFDDSGYLSDDGISMKMKYSNALVDGLDYEITDADILDELKIKNAKIVFEIEEGPGLSLANTTMKKSKEFLIEDLEFLDEIEDKLYVFCTDSNALGQHDGVNAKIKYSVMLMENGEYVEKACDYIMFTVKSYKRHYINEHAEAMFDDGMFKKVMQSGFAKQMMGIENTKDFGFTQILNDSLLKNLVDAASPLDEVQAYHIVVADLISAMNNDVTSSVNEVFGDKALECSSQLLELFVEVTERYAFSDQTKEIISRLSSEDILKHLSSVEKDPAIDEVVETMLKDTHYHKRLLDKLGGAKKVNNICKVGGIVLNTYKDVQNVMLVNAALDSIEKMLVEQKDVLESLSDTAKSNGEYELAIALSAYTTYETDVTDSMIKACVDTVLMTNADSIFSGVALIAGEQIKNAFAENIKVTLGEKVFTGAVVAEAFGTVMMAYEYGRLVSDLICNNSDYADSCLRLVMTGHISESLFEVILKYHSLMLEETKLDKAFEYAQSLDYALNMYKKVEIMACDGTVDALKARATSVAVQMFWKDKGQDYAEQIANVKALKAKLSGTYCHDVCLANIYAEIMNLDKIEIPDISKPNNNNTDFKVVSVQCPVDVIVRNGKGQIVASVENNVATKETDGIEIFVLDDEKFICLPSTGEYDVEIVATDEGTMDYTVFEYGPDNLENIRSVSYESIPLTPDKTFVAKLDTEKYTDKKNYNLSVGSEIITATADDYVPVTGISLKDNAVNTVFENNEITLKVTSTPENASVQNYIWSSSDENIATVRGGIVRGVKAGTATITCKLKDDSSITDSFTVTVKACSHGYSDWIVGEDSTCSEYGYEYRSCSVCKTVQTRPLTVLLAHTPDTVSVTIPGTCVNNSRKAFLCVECGAECESEEIPDTKISHAFTKYVSDKNATYVADGTKTAKCDYGCGNKKTVTDKKSKLLLGTTDSISFTSKTGSITLKWNEVEDATGYRVFVYDGSWKTLKDTTALTYTASSLKAASRYRYAVKAYVVVNGEKVFAPKYATITAATQPTAVTKITTKAKAYSVDLTWTKISGVDGYRVFRYNSSTKKWVKITDTASLKATVKNLKANTKYRFAVKGYYVLDGEKVFVNEYASVYTTTLVGKTTSLKATTTQSTVKLTWASVSGATGYRVYQYDYNKKASDKLTDTTKLNYTVKNLKPGTQYRFSVKAYKTVDGKKYWSDVYTIVVTSTLPGKTTSLKATTTQSTVKLTWASVLGATGYRVYQYDYNKKASVKLTDTTKLNYTVKNLKPGTQYRFSVKAYKTVDGKKYWSDVYTIVVTSTLPGKTTSLKATTTQSTVKLTWASVSGATGYRVYQYDYNKKASDKLTDTTKLNYTVKNLKPGTQYRFSVKAYKTVDGKKYWSDVYTIVVTKTKT